MDYRFAIRCWQDLAGSDNAKANIFVDGTQVATDVEITATSAASPQIVTWESTGLTAPADDTSFAVKVVLTNEYYVDASTDRNIHIDGIGYITKKGGNYVKGSWSDATPSVYSEANITDFSDYNNYRTDIIPSAVSGDQIASDFWTSRPTDGFYTVTVWGSSESSDGVTMTFPVVVESNSGV